MSTVLHSKPVSRDNLAEKLGFQQRLQTVTNKIHATKNIDEIILELSQELCNLFGADRLTIYLTSEDRGSIVSKVKTGLNSFKDIKLPINEQSIAGYVACNKRVVNIRDVYDDVELKSYSPQLNFLKAVDAKTGYRTKQMLVAPVVEAKSKELIGVVQIINFKAGQTFPPHMEEGVVQLCETLAIAFRQRQGSMMQVRTRYDGLVTNAVISAEELELAQRSARRKNLDMETVLIEESGQAPGAGRGALVLFRRAVRAVQVGPHEVARPYQKHEPRLLQDQSLGPGRGQQGWHRRRGDRPRADQGLEDGEQHLSQEQDRLPGDHQSRVRPDARSAVRQRRRIGRGPWRHR
jgi:GAF domain-containing protein